MKRLYIWFYSFKTFIINDTLFYYYSKYIRNYKVNQPNDFEDLRLKRVYNIL